MIRISLSTSKRYEQLSVRGMPVAVFVEDWGASYGSAYLVTQDDAGSASAELVEDGQDLRSARRRAPGAP